MQQWLRLPSTQHHSEVPLLFREPYIQRGFRQLHQPWRYYLLSVFQLHNETMNVWTHIVAVLLMGQRLWQLLSEVDLRHDAYSWPLLGGVSCGIVLYSCSSLAHCLQSHSHFSHYVAFMLDYAGVGLYGLGSLLLHLVYSSHDNFYYAVHDFYLAIGGVVAFAISYCCTMAKLLYARPYPFMRKIWQMAPVGAIYVLIIAPIVHRLWMCFLHDQDCGESIQYHSRQIAWFAVSAFFFASHWPQSTCPGRFDVFLHSHQLFHIAIMMCTLDQLSAVVLDFKARSDIIRSRPIPTVSSVLGPILLVALAQLLCIILYSVKVYKRLPESGKQKVNISSLQQIVPPTEAG